LAARQQVGTRLSKQKLHALGNHESSCKRQRQSHPTRVPFPKLSSPDERHGCATAGGWTWDEDDAYKEDDGGWDDESNDGHEPCWNRLMVLKGVRYVEVDRRKGSFIGCQVLPASTDGGYGTVHMSVVLVVVVMLCEHQGMSLCVVAMNPEYPAQLSAIVQQSNLHDSMIRVRSCFTKVKSHLHNPVKYVRQYQPY
jgi:hypothetical protein